MDRGRSVVRLVVDTNVAAYVLLGTPKYLAETRAFWLEQQLQTKLGKSRTYPSTPDTPYWKLVRRVQASLSDRGSSRRVPNGRVVAIRISEPDGP